MMQKYQKNEIKTQKPTVKNDIDGQREIGRETEESEIKKNKRKRKNEGKERCTKG